MKIGFIGYGNMAGAIAKGLISHQVIEPSNIYASARDYEKLKMNTSKLNINPCIDSKEVIQSCDMIILAVKPYQIQSVLEPIREVLSEKLIVSIAAGKYFDEYVRMIPNTHHISTIPNTPIEIGKGILICEKKHSLTDNQLDDFLSIFSKIALVEFVETEQFSIAGTLSGCTPAFSAMYLEALGDAGVKYGLTRQQSYRLAAKMLEGVGSLYLQNQEHPGLMKDAVCSPKGTTILGVSSLESDGFRGSVIRAIDAIEKKSK